MVCNDCEKKIRSVITPDRWREGSRNTSTGSSGRRINENKLLTSGKRYNMPKASCKMCKSAIYQPEYTLCQKCSYKNGMCGMCGAKTMDTSPYNMSV